MEIKQHVIEKPMGQRKNQKRTQNTLRQKNENFVECHPPPQSFRGRITFAYSSHCLLQLFYHLPKHKPNCYNFFVVVQVFEVNFIEFNMLNNKAICR